MVLTLLFGLNRWYEDRVGDPRSRCPNFVSMLAVEEFLFFLGFFFFFSYLTLCVKLAV